MEIVLYQPALHSKVLCPVVTERGGGGGGGGEAAPLPFYPGGQGGSTAGLN